MAKVYLVNFANEKFYESQEFLNKNCLNFGVDKTISFTLDEIKKTNFYKKNKELMERKRWVGWGMWKPYVILEALKKIKDGDILVYSDSGISFKSSLKPLINRCDEKGIVLIESTPLMRQFTKRDTFVLTGCDKEEYYNSPQVMAGLNFWKKTPMSMKIVSEWLEFCKDRRIITDDANECGLPNLPEYVDPRGDQSILSILSVKYKDYIDHVGPLEYTYYDEKLKTDNSLLWEVHRRRKRAFLEWAFWKLKLITPVSAKNKVKWFLNNYFKK